MINIKSNIKNLSPTDYLCSPKRPNEFKTIKGDINNNKVNSSGKKEFKEKKEIN